MDDDRHVGHNEGSATSGGSAADDRLDQADSLTGPPPGRALV